MDTKVKWWELYREPRISAFVSRDRLMERGFISEYLLEHKLELCLCIIPRKLAEIWLKVLVNISLSRVVFLWAVLGVGSKWGNDRGQNGSGFLYLWDQATCDFNAYLVSFKYAPFAVSNLVFSILNLQSCKWSSLFCGGPEIHMLNISFINLFKNCQIVTSSFHYYSHLFCFSHACPVLPNSWSIVCS